MILKMRNLYILPRTYKTYLKKRLYRIENDILMFLWNEKVLFELPNEHVKCLLRYYHYNMSQGVHASAEGIIKKVQKYWHWIGYQQDVRDYCASCAECQLQKKNRPSRGTKLRLWQPRRPNEVWAIDHTGPYPDAVDGNKYVTSILDKFSDEVWAYAVPNLSARQTALTMFQHMNKFGVPGYWTCDRGSDFTSEIVEHLTRLSGTRLRKTISFYPQGNAQVENWHQELKAGFRVLSHSLNERWHDVQMSEWPIYLSSICSAHNSTALKKDWNVPESSLFWQRYQDSNGRQCGHQSLRGCE